MEESRFKVVFLKVEEEVKKDQGVVQLAKDVQELQQELDEVAELRRFVEQISNPLPKSYTTT